jgi:hypothetical protein
MREQKQEPGCVARLWRNRLKPVMDAWLYLESLGRLVLAAIAVGVFVVSGVTYARHWLAASWFVFVLVIAVVVVMVPWVPDLWARTGGSRGKHRTGVGQRRPVSVEYAGIRWIHTGGFYWGSGSPIGRAECPVHKVRLFYREGSPQKSREPRDDDFIGPYWGALFCVAGGGHRLEIPEEFTRKSFGELKSEAEALLEAELAVLQRRT